MKRAVAVVVAAAGLSLAGVLGTASPVAAHAILDSSSPAASTVLAQAPGEIALDFSEPVEERFASIRLFEAGESDREIGIGAPRRLSTDASALIATIPPIPDGLYVVVWRVTSADGHPVRGAFPFEVGDVSSGRGPEALDRIISSLQGGSDLGVPLGFARFLSYAGAVLLIGLGAPRRLSTDASALIATIPPIPDGLYVVVWRVTSADGHPVRGAFPFEVGDVSSGRGPEALDRIISSLQGGSDLGVPLGFARFLSYAGAILLIGSIVLHWRGSGLSRVRTVRSMTIGALAFVVGALAILLLQGAHNAGVGWSGITDATLIVDVAGTRVGLSIVARLVLGVFWIAVILGAARGLGSGAPWQNAAFLTAIATTFTFPPAGHLGAVQWPALHIPLGALHVGTVSIWIGGLIGAVIGRNEDAGLVQRLSRLATWAMPVAVVTGMVNAVRVVGGVSELAGDTYGRTLALKVSLVLAAVVCGLVVRRRLRAGVETGPSLRAEMLAAVAILAVTASLTGTSPVGAGGAQAFTATLSQSGVIVDLAVSPARVGTAEVHVIFTPPGGALDPVSGVEMRIELPSRDVPAVPVEVVPAGPNHFVGIVRIPYAGEWSVEVRGKNGAGILRWSTTMPIDP